MSPRKKTEFELIPEKVPPRGARTSVYDRIVADFLKQGEQSVRVVVHGPKPPSVRISLKKAVDRSGAKLEVVSRGDDTYLVRA